MSNDHSLRELSDVILQGYRAQAMVVAGSALLITMMKENGLPRSDLQSVASDLRKFLEEKRIPDEEVNGITLSSYDDVQKWKSIKEEITAALDSSRQESWDSKPLVEWNVDDTLKWLTDKKLSQYCRAFKENDMDGQNMLELNEIDLRDLGIRSIGHRKTFMRNLSEAKKITPVVEEEAMPEAPKPPSYEIVEDHGVDREQPREYAYNSVIVRGLPEGLLNDEDTLFDIENLAFSGFALESFNPTGDGILVTFENPLTIARKEEVREKFVEVMQNLTLDSQLRGPLTFDFWDDGKIVELPVTLPVGGHEKPKKVEKDFDDEVKVATPSPPPPPKRTNYWKEFWIKLVTNGDAEDFFDDEETKLNLRGAREVLATIRDVKLKEIKKDDPGIKHLKGFTQNEIEAALSDCLLDVMYEIENQKPVEIPAPNPPLKEDSPPLDQSGKGVYVGMSIEGLPRSITADDNIVHSIQSIVFKDVAVQRLIVHDDKSPPVLKVEFEKYITKEKIPQLARNLKNFLKAVNVDQKALNDVTIAFLEDGWKRPPNNAPKEIARGPGPGHKRRGTGDFLVNPGESIEMTRTFMIEGIPAKYLNQTSFLNDMPEKVFDGVPLDRISIPPAKKWPDGTMTQGTGLEIRFKQPLNIQKLPMIAMKLKKFLKRHEIPPRVVNQVTLQVRHEESAPPISELEAHPVVGLIFKGIPQTILESNKALYDMESTVFTEKHPVRSMEPNEADQMLRITIINPIRSQQELTTIAQRLKRFLGKQGVSQKGINEVLVMSFNREKWQQLDQPAEKTSSFNPNQYVGIEIEHMPASIVDSDKQLEDIERIVFSKQKVVHMNVLDTTLKITFGVPADSKAIEKVARQLKQFLSHMKIPMKQINDIVIAPYTKETWDQP